MEKGFNLVPDLLCTLVLVLSLALAQAAGATTTIMSNKKPSAAPKHGYLYSKDDDDGHYHRPDKCDTVLPPSLLQRQREVIAPRNRELCQQSTNSYNV
jgi:hypothetical protein